MFSRFGQRRHLSQRVLNEYLDALLPAAARQGADRHLLACAACRRELEGINGVVSLLRQVPQVAVRRSFTMTAPPRAVVKAPLPLRLPTWSYAGAASLAGLVLAVLVSADAVGIPGMVWRDTQSEALIAAPAPLGRAAEGTPQPGDDQSLAAKSAEQASQAPEAGQVTGSGYDADSSPGSTPQPGPAAASAPPGGPPDAGEPQSNLGQDTEPMVAHDAEGEFEALEKNFGYFAPGPTPWFWRALEGLAAVTALLGLLGLLVRYRRARR